MATKHLKWTGERLTTQATNSTVSHHLHRYALAIELSTDKNVLDIACGEGYGSNFLAKNANSVIGIDIDSATINHAKNKYIKQNLTFIKGSAHKIPVIDNTIDLAVSFETIEHHDKHVEMLLELKRVLKPDGIVHLKTDSEFMHGYTLGLLHGEGHEVLYANHDVYKQEGSPEEVTSIQTYYESQYLEHNLSLIHI